MSVLKIDKDSLWEAIKEWSRKAGRATTRRVDDTLDRWFPEYKPYEMIEA